MRKSRRYRPPLMPGHRTCPRSGPAGLHQVVHRPQHFLDGGHAVPHVEVAQVDAVGLEAQKAALDGFGQARAGCGALTGCAATVTMPAIPPRAARRAWSLPCMRRCLCRERGVRGGAFAASGVYAEVPLPRAGCTRRCLCRERGVRGGAFAATVYARCLCRERGVRGGAFAASGLYASGAWACGGWGGIAYFVAIATGAGELPDYLLRGPVGVGVRRVDEVPVALPSPNRSRRSSSPGQAVTPEARYAPAAGSAGSVSGRCGAVDSHIHVTAQELQRGIHQEPRCQPVAFAPLSVSSRAATEREQNEAQAESKTAGGKAHASDGTAVPVLPWPDQTPHNGDRSRGSGAVIWCVHRDASCRRLPGHISK